MTRIDQKTIDKLKEGAALIWEDARRTVFHTGIVMFELSRTLR